MIDPCCPELLRIDGETIKEIIICSLEFPIIWDLQVRSFFWDLTLSASRECKPTAWSWKLRTQTRGWKKNGNDPLVSVGCFLISFTLNILREVGALPQEAARYTPPRFYSDSLASEPVAATSLYVWWMDELSLNKHTSEEKYLWNGTSIMIYDQLFLRKEHLLFHLKPFGEHWVLSHSS